MGSNPFPRTLKYSQDPSSFANQRLLTFKTVGNGTILQSEHLKHLSISACNSLSRDSAVIHRPPELPNPYGLPGNVILHATPHVSSLQGIELLSSLVYIDRHMNVQLFILGISRSDRDDELSDAAISQEPKVWIVRRAVNCTNREE
jgi:hypothetical protein